MPESQVRLSSDTVKVLNRVKGWSGQPYTQIVAKVIAWLGSHDDATIGAIIGGVPDTLQPDFAKLILEKMAKGGVVWSLDAAHSPSPASKNPGTQGSPPKQSVPVEKPPRQRRAARQD